MPVAEDKNIYVTLNSGYKMPVIGLGTWTLNDSEAMDAVYTAIRDGYRLIDTAEYYYNEVGVGEGIRKAIAEGIVTREEVFLTTKVSPGSYDSPARGIAESLEKLNVGYIDLLLIHQPGHNDKGVYRAMENAVGEGTVRSIGISNYYTRSQIDEVLSYAKIVPAIIQNENHIFYQNNMLQDYVKEKGIFIESWYPFGGRGHTEESFSQPVILELAKKYKKTPAQIILRFNIQAGYIAVPGSKNHKHIAENINVFDFSLSETDMNQIYAVNESKRYENW